MLGHSSSRISKHRETDISVHTYVGSRLLRYSNRSCRETYPGGDIRAACFQYRLFTNGIFTTSAFLLFPRTKTSIGVPVLWRGVLTYPIAMFFPSVGLGQPLVTLPTNSEEAGSIISAPSLAGAPSTIKPTRLCLGAEPPSLAARSWLSIVPSPWKPPLARLSLCTIQLNPASTGVVLSFKSCP